MLAKLIVANKHMRKQKQLYGNQMIITEGDYKDHNKSI